MKIKRILCLVTGAIIITSLSSCDFNITLGGKTSTVETAKNNFLKEFEKGINVTVNNQEMDYASAYSYINSHYNGDEYTLQMKSLLDQLDDVCNDYSKLYISYVKSVKKTITTEDTDFYNYKSKELNTYISSSTIDGILDLVKRLDEDEQITASLESLNASSTKELQLSNYCASTDLNINSSSLQAYINTFAENYKELSYMSTTCQTNIDTFLDTYTIELKDTNTIDYEGYTSFTDGLATGLLLKNDSDTLKMLGTLSHEIGHVSDTTLSRLENDETYACMTEVLTYYLANSFDFASSNTLVTKYYQQRVLHDIVNSFYGWVGYLAFIQQVYENETTTYGEILNYMSNTYSPVSYSYSKDYELLWKVMFIYYAYYDIANSGSFVYTYGAINSAYIWDLYSTNPTDAVTKYQALMPYEGNFKNYSSIGLIGESNISTAYESLKKIITKNIELYKELTNIQ